MGNNAEMWDEVRRMAHYVIVHSVPWLVVMNLSFSPNQSKVVLAASNDNVARVWNLSDQACKVSVATCHTTTILILAPPPFFH